MRIYCAWHRSGVQGGSVRNVGGAGEPALGPGRLAAGACRARPELCSWHACAVHFWCAWFRAVHGSGAAKGSVMRGAGGVRQGALRKVLLALCTHLYAHIHTHAQPCTPFPLPLRTTTGRFNYERQEGEEDEDANKVACPSYHFFPLPGCLALHCTALLCLALHCRQSVSDCRLACFALLCLLHPLRAASPGQPQRAGHTCISLGAAAGSSRGCQPSYNPSPNT